MIEYVPADSVPLPDLRDLYGTCKLGAKCICLDPRHPQHVGWLGRLCIEWTPLGPRTQEELAAYRLCI